MSKTVADLLVTRLIDVGVDAILDWRVMPQMAFSSTKNSPGQNPIYSGAA